MLLKQALWASRHQGEVMASFLVFVLSWCPSVVMVAL
jgi:hypothetical protein